MATPKIEPIKTKNYELPQSKFKNVGSLPLRAILLGSSGTGKTILIQNMILKIYRNLFERIYIFSPSIHVDSAWDEVKKHLDNIKRKENEPELLYDNYDEQALTNIVDTQKKITQHLKSNKATKKLYQILVVIDDLADNKECCRNSRLLHSLYTRGRHSCISTICATQKFTALSPIIRVNATELYVFRLRNYIDLQTFLDEVSGLLGDKKALLEMYHYAMSKEYNFLYCRLTAKNVNEMFFSGFGEKLVVEDDD